MHDYFNKSNLIMKKIDEEFYVLWKINIQINIKKKEVGKEYQVEDNINNSIARFKYYSNRWIYHANLFIEAINKEIKGLENIIPPSNQDCDISTPPSNQNAAYEFDAFLSAIGTILENNIKEDFLQKLSSKNKNKFENFWNINQKANGIFWRINVLRNRVVHSDNEVFTFEGLKFIEFSSEILNIRITNFSNIEFQSHLIDIKNNINLYDIINNEIIEESKKINHNFKQEKKNYMHSNCMPIKPNFFSVIFSDGKKLKNPYMAISGHIDLIETFNSIIEDLNIFYIDMFDILKNDLNDKNNI
ncbi:hypothetical protein [Aliarcobacter cryaerophilus]|uniref:hypothetical protein n=1 Tax=Aliarcobacter cryaerophilus TaxID=28198 RepID=UPI0021B69AAB|nr:hypothetical protein [Aliarcobacter cryaerophilus]MCT7405876.1 hypothetical protein [Aliarcobacter cryaerophilus]MCT7503577.1 hypothetical protein [Aliarcobacter cryaerophilus]